MKIKKRRKKTEELPAPTWQEVRYRTHGLNDLITRKVDWSKKPQ